MAGVLDMATIEELIEEGRKRGIPSGIVAELIEDPVSGEGDGASDASGDRAACAPSRVLSPIRTHEDLDGSSLGTVSYHSRTLQRLGIVELVERIPRRGAIEHVYRLATVESGR